MDDDLIQAYGRLTMHDLALEVLYANLLAQTPQADAEQVLQDLIDQLRYAMYVPSDAVADEESAFLVQKYAAALIEGFANRVRERTDRIRAKLS